MSSSHPDIRVTHDGSITRLTIVSDEGEYVLKTKVKTEPWQWFGGALCIDTRVAGDLLNRLINVENLVVI